ncbi:MAG: shikimate dehydrogenase [Candidatus Azotimanducaceae bacterium]|jgi:shikimate dehydrogenase
MSFKLQVVGNPITHSRSPEIHTAFAQQFERDLSYEKVQVELDGFSQHADAFLRNGQGLGMNITVPFKEDAFRYADELDRFAEQAGAVNTLRRDKGRVIGYNTDGVGLVRDITDRWQCVLNNKVVLILGAGGSTRGILRPLLIAGVKAIVIANRTFEKAELLVRQSASERVTAAHLPVALTVLDPIGAEGFDVVINTTSLGLQSASAHIKDNIKDNIEDNASQGIDALVDVALVKDTFCYDLSYGAQARFCQWAQAAGARQSVDGLGMLVEQAAESYALWFSERPLTEPVYLQLRKEIERSSGSDSE